MYSLQFPFRAPELEVISLSLGKWLSRSPSPPFPQKTQLPRVEKTTQTFPAGWIGERGLWTTRLTEVIICI